MKHLRIVLTLVFGVIFFLTVHHQPPASACQGNRCAVPTVNCIRSIVLAKAAPFVFVASTVGPVTVNVPANLFLTCANSMSIPPGCGGATPCSNTISSASLTITVFTPLIASATISTAAGTMTPPNCIQGTTPGVFNPYSVSVNLPATTTPGVYLVLGNASVTFADGVTMTATGDTEICLVEESPTQPGEPRLDVELLTPNFPRLAPGDQAAIQYLVTNRDNRPGMSVNFNLFADAQQNAVHPGGANANQGVYSLSNKFGDDFAIDWDLGDCIPLPPHPFIQPGINRGGQMLNPGESRMYTVRMRSYGQCGTGSCDESFLRVTGTFSDGSPALACAGMALYVDTSVPTTGCGMGENDCNRNGIPDADDIERGTSSDANFNAVPDECMLDAGSPRFQGLAQVNPSTVEAGVPIEIVALALAGSSPISNVFANGRPLTHQGGGIWRGMIPSAQTIGDQAVALTAVDGNGKLAGTSGFYRTTDPRLQLVTLPRPVRLLDTRPGFMGCDAPGMPVAGGTSLLQTAAGRTCEGITIPANALAITGHITSVQSGGGFATAYPSWAPRPLVSTTNYLPNEIVNNVFTVGLGAEDGAFKLFALTTTHFVVDVTGVYVPRPMTPTATAPQGGGGLYFHPLSSPIRLLDTRCEPACNTNGCLPLAPGSTLTQQATGSCGGVTIPANARAVVGNATVVGPSGDGFLTIYPSDAMERPLAASSNYSAGQIVNGPFTVALGPDGAFKVFTLAATHLVTDLTGYYSPDAVDINGPGLLFTPFPYPVRLLETRNAPPDLPGCFKPNAPLIGGVEYMQQARVTCQGVTIPMTSKAILGNATVVNNPIAGFLTFWPSDVIDRPLIATSNYNAGQVWNRHFIVGLGTDGVFKMYAHSTTDLVIDVSGSFSP